MIKILLAGLLSDNNLGDPVIFQCTRYLLLKSFERRKTSIAFSELDFQTVGISNKIISFTLNLFNRTQRIFKINSTLLQKIKIHYLSKSYAEVGNDCNAIVVVGGGLIKYTYQECHIYLSALSIMATRLRLPLYLNAVGVENFDITNSSCRLLKNALNACSIKYISTRDHISIMNHDYLHDRTDIYTQLVADPAVFASECYGINCNTTINTIGIGIIRGQIFTDNGLEFKGDDLFRFYINLVHYGLSNGHNLVLFTNGLPADIRFSNKIIKTLKKEYGINIEERHPKNPNELVSIISSFHCIIAARLHALIIAYSLNVPAIGLIWNNKIDFWGHAIGYKDRFMTIQEFVPEKIFKKMIEAIKQNYNQKDRKVYRDSAIESIEFISDSIEKLDRF